MTGARDCLPIGTQIETEQGSIYEITGVPIGFGGGSILYPVRKMLRQGEHLQVETFFYALKECYPVSVDHGFLRNDQGAIVPAQDSREAAYVLRQAQKRQLAEGAVSQAIFKTASRMVPVRESSQTIGLTFPGREKTIVANTVTIMDSLSEKGRSLAQWIQDQGRFSPVETFRVLQQLLFSLREVHQAGYLHLDLQDGNVFLRGSLDDRSELATLIDFGSARCLEGKQTAPIRDRGIFTTRGFSAPEILLCNDGNLCLGPEADLYSVGCLALFLLTGQRPDARILMANRTGIYLAQNQLRRIKCPKHLVARLQGVLGRALKKDPEQRYHSAEEMLAEVTELVDALQPYRSDLRSVDYDAFICYKHGATDSEAAKILQQKLEHFHPPRGISSMKTPFRRVFVDEGELSSCADFGAQIHEALKHSGWLIVVCSPQTPLSPWVKSEIDTFLQYHDRSRILAVLTEGEPEQSFPPQLLGVPDGSSQVLAADARGENLHEVRKKLSADALLRLAAPMLGTTFDSLKQRRKSQILQRVAAVSMAGLFLAAAFSTYALRQNQRIQEEYRNHLISESKHLAALAQNAYETGDPLTALEIALRALPSENQDRPVIPQAQFVMEQALGLYTLNAGNLIGPATAQGAYLHERSVLEHDFCWDSSRNILISCDNRGICLFDTQRGTGVGRIPLAYDYYVVFRPELVLQEVGHLFYGCLDHIFYYDYVNQRELWNYGTPEDYKVCAMQYLPEQDQLAVILTDLFSDHVTVELLDAQTGSCLKEYPIPLAGTVESIYNPRCALSQDERVLAFAIAFYTEEELASSTDLLLQSSVALLDLSTGTVRYVHPQAGWVSGLAFTPEDQLLVAMLDGGNEKGSFYASFQESTATILNIDPASATVRWQVQDTFAGFQERTKIRLAEDQDLAIVSYGNRCLVLSSDTGAVIRNYELSESVVNVGALQGDSFLVCTADGYQHLCKLETPDWFAVRYFPDSIEKIVGHQGTFFLVRGDSSDIIHQYELFPEDENWKQLTENADHPLRSYSQTATEDGVIVLYGQYGEPVTLVDIASGQIRHTMLDAGLEECDIRIEKMLGIHALGGEDTLLFSCQDICGEETHGYACGILTVNMQTLEQNMLYLPRPEERLLQRDYALEKGSGLTALDTYQERTVFLNADAVYYAGDMSYFSCMVTFCDEEGVDQEGVFWYSWKIGSSELPQKIAQFYQPQKSPALRNQSCRFGGIVPSKDGKHGVLVLEEHGEDGSSAVRVLCADLQTGRWQQISQGLEPTHSFRYGNNSEFGVWWDEEGKRFVMLWDGAAVICSADGREQSRIDFTDMLHQVESMYVVPGTSHLMVWSDGDLLTMFDLDTGKRLAQEQIPYFVESYSSDLTWTLMDEHMLLLEFSSWMAVMDPSEETWGVCSVIPNGIGYEPSADRFFTRAEGANGAHPLGWFRRYTIEEMVAMGSSRSESP